MSTTFYADLPVRDDLRALASADAYTQMPGDWYVVMSDVRDSTVAIESGSYKNVNTCGAATIAAMLNAGGPVENPFVFEGDGSMLCVPEELIDAARAALLQTQEMARKSFGLDLRVGAIRQWVRSYPFVLFQPLYACPDGPASPQHCPTALAGVTS